MPDIFDELTAQQPPPTGLQFPDVYPRATAVNAMDEILAQIMRPEVGGQRSEIGGLTSDFRLPTSESGDIFDQLAQEQAAIAAAPTFAPQTVEVPPDEQTAIREAYGPGSFQARTGRALQAWDPMLALQIAGEATERGLERLPTFEEVMTPSRTFWPGSEQMPHEARPLEEVQKSLDANVDEPTRRAYKAATGQDMPPTSKVQATLATAGYNLLADTVNFFNSPEGAAVTVATGGVGAIAPAVRQFVALGFSADAASHALEAGIQGRWADALESLGMAGLLGKGASHEAKAAYAPRQPQPGVVTPGEAQARGLEPRELTAAEIEAARPIPRDVFDELVSETAVAPTAPAPEVAPPIVEPRPPEAVPPLVEQPPEAVPPAAPPITKEQLKTAVEEAGPPPAEAPPAPWYETIGEPAKQSVFAAMRDIQTRIDSARAEEAKLKPKGGRHGVGAADFDEFMRGETQAEVLRGLQKGMTPDQAGEAAKAWAIRAVEKHNARRPNQIDWQRWERTGEGWIDLAVRNVKEAVTPPEAKPPAPIVEPPPPIEQPPAPALPVSPEEIQKRIDEHKYVERDITPPPPAIAPQKNDIVTVAMGGREYPKTRITNIVETPEGTRYQVDVFGQKFVPAEQIVSIDQPFKLPEPPAKPPATITPEQIEQYKKADATEKARKAAERLAKAPDTAPQKMRVQKAFLLDALDTAHKGAGEAAAPIADADAQRLEATSPYRHGPDYYSADEPTKQGFREQRVADLAPLIQKYGLTDYRYREPAQTIYSMSGAPEFREAIERPATYEELMSELKNRIGEARAKEIPKITIEVPGDGIFEIVNTKEAIANFRNEVRKRFPTVQARAALPTLGGRTTPEAIPAVKAAKTREDLIKIMGRAASTDETRFVLHQVVASTGKELVATDGRRLIKIDHEGPKINVKLKGKPETTKAALFDIKTLKRDTKKEEGTFPNWKQVVPDTSKLGTHKKVATVDTGALMKLITQAEQVMGERTQSVKLWMDDKGKLGITASTPEVGEFAGGDANPNTAKPLGAYNPEFLKDGFHIARQLGHEKVDLYYHDEMSPISLKAKGMEYVLMPMRIDSFAGDYAAIHPAATDPGVLRTRTRADVFNELRGVGVDQAIREMDDRGIPFTETQKIQELRDARLTMGKRQPTHEEFETALRSDLEKWNPEGPATVEAAVPAVTAVSIADVQAALKKAYPYQGVKTGSEAKAFVAKAKRLLEPLGVPRDVVDSAIDATRVSGPTVMWPSDVSILRGLVKTGWLKQEPSPPRAAGGAVGSPLGAPVAAPIGKPVAPAPPPVIPPGQVMMGKLPVTMERTRPGAVAPGQVIDSLRDLDMAIGGTGEIHKGRFNMRRYAGVYKPFSETIRLGEIDNIPTAVHEIGHSIAKQFYGTSKSRGLGGYPPAVKRELIALGKALYGKTRPNAGYTAEGLSEFMRLYLTTDDGARQSAPATLDFFENKVLKDHPEIVAPLKETRALMDTYRFQGSEARIAAQMQREPGWTRRILDALGHFFSPQGQAESGLPLKWMSQEAAFRLAKAQVARGKPVPIRELPPSADPYKLFKAKRGSSGPIIETMVEDHMVDPWGNPIGPGLREAFAQIPRADMKKFTLYLYGKIAEKRWAEGKNPGISREDATFIRSTTETPEFQRASDKYLQWMRGVLDYLGEADPVAWPLVDKLKAESFYAPLARLLDPRMARTQAMRAQSNSLYRIHGSGLPVKNIIEQSLRSAERIVTYANRRLVSNAIIKLARIPGMGKMIEEVPRAVAHKQVNFENIRDGLEGMGLDTDMIPEDTMLEWYTPADRPKGSDPIIPWKDAQGATHWYRVHPKIYDALEKLEPWSLRNLHPQLGPVLDLFFGAPKRTFTLGTTGLRPTFSLVTNPLRDPQGWLLQTKAGVNPPKMAAAYVNAMREVLTGLVTGKPGPYQQIARNLGTAMSQPIGRDVRYTRHAAKGLFEQGRVMRVVRNPIDHLRQLLGAPESFPRLAELQRVADEIGWKPGDPLSPDQSVELALGYKEATVDFSAAGDASRIINESVPFYNPTIQGMRTAVRTFRDHPVRTVLWGLSAFTAPALYQWWKNKDKFWYRNLPWRERYYYSNIDDGKHVWQIPRAFEWSNIFQVVPEAAFDSWYQKDPRAVEAALGHIFATQMPVHGLEDIMGVPGRVAKEQWSNHIDFWDHPIVPRSEQDLPPASQVGPYTSKAAQWIGKALATIPGLPKETQSPRRIDAAMRSFFGGTAPDLLDAVGLGSVKKEREAEFADIPVIGRLARRGGYYNPQSQYLADFWDINEKLQAKAQAVSMQMNDPNRVQAVPIDDPDLMFASIFDSSAKNITFAMRMANQMKESAARSSIYEDMAREAKQLVDDYNLAQKQINANR